MVATPPAEHQQQAASDDKKASFRHIFHQVMPRGHTSTSVMTGETGVRLRKSFVFLK
jgi:hypothetical protein